MSLTKKMNSSSTLDIIDDQTSYICFCLFCFFLEREESRIWDFLVRIWTFLVDKYFGWTPGWEQEAKISTKRKMMQHNYLAYPAQAYQVTTFPTNSHGKIDWLIIFDILVGFFIIEWVFFNPYFVFNLQSFQTNICNW